VFHTIQQGKVAKVYSYSRAGSRALHCMAWLLHDSMQALLHGDLGSVSQSLKAHAHVPSPMALRLYGLHRDALQSLDYYMKCESGNGRGLQYARDDEMVHDIYRRFIHACAWKMEGDDVLLHVFARARRAVPYASAARVGSCLSSASGLGSGGRVLFIIYTFHSENVERYKSKTANCNKRKSAIGRESKDRIQYVEARPWVKKIAY
jgi:hypothetical protein